MIVGFTCGTFDLVHAGHVLMLQEASEVCDYLIVGLHIDPSKEREWKNKPVKCAPAHKVVEVMQSKGEHPIIWMDGFAQLPDKIAKSKYVVSLNRETFTWTIIEFMNPTSEGAFEDACILGFGRGVINMNLINNDGGIQL